MHLLLPLSFPRPREGAAEAVAGRAPLRRLGLHGASANLESTVTQAGVAAVVSNSAVQACHQCAHTEIHDTKGPAFPTPPVLRNSRL